MNTNVEDRINALLTKDPNKLKVYSDGYDGHCLRAFSYFGDQMPDIVDTVVSINSIKTKYEGLRGDSKAPTFLLTYGGTYHGLMRNCGFGESQAKAIEARYRELYAVSEQWVKSKLNQACKDGYVELAFGLRMRTPILKRSVLETSRTLKEAEQEARSAGNALSGQSYGLLNNRAAIAFFKLVDASPYKYDIYPVALIHDAIYLLIRDDVEVVAWANKHLTHEMAWQDLPEIAHPDVHLGAELDIYYPTWKDAITLPNNATPSDILDIVANSMKEAA